MSCQDRKKKEIRITETHKNQATKCVCVKHEVSSTTCLYYVCMVNWEECTDIDEYGLKLSRAISKQVQRKNKIKISNKRQK